MRAAGVDKPGRAAAIAELLRMGHPPALVSEAVRLADAGRAADAIDLLLERPRAETLHSTDHADAA